MAKITSIRITDDTKKKLSKIGEHGETYEEIIIKLLERK